MTKILGGVFSGSLVFSANQLVAYAARGRVAIP